MREDGANVMATVYLLATLTGGGKYIFQSIGLLHVKRLRETGDTVCTQYRHSQGAQSLARNL